MGLRLLLLKYAHKRCEMIGGKGERLAREEEERDDEEGNYRVGARSSVSLVYIYSPKKTSSPLLVCVGFQVVHFLPAE